MDNFFKKHKLILITTLLLIQITITIGMENEIEKTTNNQQLRLKRSFGPFTGLFGGGGGSSSGSVSEVATTIGEDDQDDITQQEEDEEKIELIKPNPNNKHYPIWRIHKYNGIDIKPLPISLIGNKYQSQTPQQQSLFRPSIQYNNAGGIVEGINGGIRGSELQLNIRANLKDKNTNNNHNNNDEVIDNNDEVIDNNNNDDNDDDDTIIVDAAPTSASQGGTVIPNDLKDLANKLGIKDIKNLPNLKEAMNLLGTTTESETIDIIRELASTPDGLQLIKSYLKDTNTDSSEIQEEEFNYQNQNQDEDDQNDDVEQEQQQQQHLTLPVYQQQLFTPIQQSYQQHQQHQQQQLYQQQLPRHLPSSIQSIQSIQQSQPQPLPQRTFLVPQPPQYQNVGGVPIQYINQPQVQPQPQPQQPLTQSLLSLTGIPLALERQRTNFGIIKNIIRKPFQQQQRLVIQTTSTELPLPLPITTVTSNNNNGGGGGGIFSSIRNIFSFNNQSPSSENIEDDEVVVVDNTNANANADETDVNEEEVEDDDEAKSQEHHQMIQSIEIPKLPELDELPKLENVQNLPLIPEIPKIHIPKEYQLPPLKNNQQTSSTYVRVKYPLNGFNPVPELPLLTKQPQSQQSQSQGGLAQTPIDYSIYEKSLTASPSPKEMIKTPSTYLIPPPPSSSPLHSSTEQINIPNYENLPLNDENYEIFKNAPRIITSYGTPALPYVFPDDEQFLLMNNGGSLIGAGSEKKEIIIKPEQKQKQTQSKSPQRIMSYDFIASGKIHRANNDAIKLLPLTHHQSVELARSVVNSNSSGSGSTTTTETTLISKDIDDGVAVDASNDDLKHIVDAVSSMTSDGVGVGQ